VSEITPKNTSIHLRDTKTGSSGTPKNHDYLRYFAGILKPYLSKDKGWAIY
jgi:hypothetical protein